MPRRPLARIAIALLLVLLAVVGYIAWRDTAQVRLSALTLQVPVQREYRLLQVSDLHGARFGPKQREIGRLLEGKRYDAIFITGDMIGEPGVDPLAPTTELLQVLKRHGDKLFYVVGNHDDRRVLDAMIDAEVQPLDAETFIQLRREAGRADLSITGRWADEPLPGPSVNVVTVIASHIPPQPEETAKLQRSPGAPVLVLAGHTHGGQIRLPFLGAVVAPYGWRTGLITRDTLFPDLRGRFVKGYYERDRLRVHVSPGLGTTLLPVRFLDQAEMTEIRLVPKR